MVDSNIDNAADSCQHNWQHGAADDGVNPEVTKAFNDFMERLFGYVPENPRKLRVGAKIYERVMHEVQKEYGLKQGDPRFLEWVFTLIGRSPVLLNDEPDDNRENDKQEDSQHV